MSQSKTRIDKHKVRSVIVWSLLLVGIGMLLVMSVQRKAALALTKVLISVDRQDAEQYLVTRDDIVSLVEHDLGYGLGAVVLRDLDLRRIERILAADDRVARSEIYLDSDQVLHIYVQQRRPVARVKSASVDYYIDEMGKVIQVAGTHPMRVPLVTGIDMQLPAHFPDTETRTVLHDVFEIAKQVAKDEFLAALVEQFHVDPYDEVWMIPKVGDERLLIGDAQELDDRFDRVKIIYRESMPRTGFNEYAELHFKWKGQVTRVKG